MSEYQCRYRNVGPSNGKWSPWRDWHGDNGDITLFLNIKSLLNNGWEKLRLFDQSGLLHVEYRKKKS